MSCLFENGLKLVNPRGYQSGQGWLWWALTAKDARSSLYLEDAATEFQVQGLELDWTIVTWDADLRWSGDDWSYHSFRGAKWTDVKKPERRQYLKNAYRVLLTRARQGMVIFVPPGASLKAMSARNNALPPFVTAAASDYRPIFSLALTVRDVRRTTFNCHRRGRPSFS